MKRSAIIVIMFALLVIPASANACLSTWLDSAMILDAPPLERPADALVLQVEALEAPDNFGRIRVRVSNPPRSLRAAAVVRVEPRNGNSCMTLGRVDGPGYVVVEPRFLTESGEIVLLAHVYQRSWSDYFFDLVGWPRYRASGAALRGYEVALERRSATP